MEFVEYGHAKEEQMNAVVNSSRSYEEILAFVKGEGLTE